MRIVEQNKTKTHKTNYTLLIIFCLLAFAGKSYAWHFGPETNASNWEYEDDFGLKVTQMNTNGSYLDTDNSAVTAPYVEFKDEDGGVLQGATGATISRKIQAAGQSGTFLVTFKFTAIVEGSTDQPENCYFDICSVNPTGSTEHNYKYIQNVGTHKTYSKNSKNYSIQTGEFKMAVAKGGWDDIHIRIWPQAGCNIHKILISDVYVTDGELPEGENNPSKWTVPSGYPSAQLASSAIPEMPETALAPNYVYFRGNMQDATATLPALPEYFVPGRISTTIENLEEGDYLVYATIAVTNCGTTNQTSYAPSTCYVYTTNSFPGVNETTCTSITTKSRDDGGGFWYPKYSTTSPYTQAYYVKKTVSLEATVSGNGKLTFTVWNYTSQSQSSTNLIAIKDFIVLPTDWNVGMSPDGAPSPAPDDIPQRKVVPDEGYTFTHTHGRVYDTSPRPSDFPSGDDKEWKTDADDPRLASDVKLQRTHEYVHDIYVMPGEVCELEPFSDFHTAHHNDTTWDNKYFDVYHRWYCYTTDKASARLTFPSGDNNDKVYIYKDNGRGVAVGHIGGLLYSGSVRGGTHAKYKAPMNVDSKLSTDKDGVFDIIAIDVACEAKDGAQTIKNITEPTLAYRHIFIIHSAQKKADISNNSSYSDSYKEETFDLYCPEGTPFQYRLENYEYRGLGNNQKPTGYYYKEPITEGGKTTFKYKPVCHYRIELLKVTRKEQTNGAYKDVLTLIGSTTILGSYDENGNFISGSDLNKNEGVNTTIESAEETLCGKMHDNLVYTYKGINGYDRVLYWKKPTEGKYRIRICAVNIKQENSKWTAEDIPSVGLENENLEYGRSLILESYNIIVLPQRDASLVAEDELYSDSYAYKYQRPENMMADYGNPTDVVNFDLTDEEKKNYMSSGNSNNDGYYKFPLSWEESAYGFGYEYNFDYDMYVIANSSLSPRVPYTRYKKGTTTKMEIHDRLYADTNGSEKGNFLYVNAASDPGHMAKINIGNNLCPTSRVYVSAWINEFNYNSETANLVFTFRGINSVTKQPENISRYVTGYIPGGCNTKDGFKYAKIYEGKDDYYPNPDPDNDHRGEWMHVYYYFDPPWDFENAINTYESFEVTIENNCTSSDGADYAIDDLRAFVCKPKIQVQQMQPICTGDDLSHLELSIDYDLLLHAYLESIEESHTAADAKTATVYYTIIDSVKYVQTLATSTNSAAVDAAVVKGIYSPSKPNSDEIGILQFSTYYEGNPLKGTNASVAQRDVSTGKRMLYFPDCIKANYLVLEPKKTYYLVMGVSTNSNNWSGPDIVKASKVANPSNRCESFDLFKISYGNVIKIDGQPTASRHGLNICSNQRPKISVDMTGVTSSGSPATGYTYDRFDWFVGNKEAFEAAKYNDVGLEESLAAFRDLSGHYTDDETALRSLSPTGSFTAGMKACLLHFIDEKKLSLYKTFEFPSTYDQFDEDPNGTSIALTIIPVDPYHNPDILFCLEPFDVIIPISTREPSMKNGDDSGVIQYTMDDVPLRIGLTQLKKCCTIDPTSDITKVTPSNYLLMPLRDVHVETTGVEALIEKSDDELIYLVDTNDPAVKKSYSAFGAKSVKTFTSTTDKTGFAEDTVLYIGKVSDIKADVWDKTDPNATNPGNKCKLAFFNNVKFREGYWYTIRFNYQEKYTSTVTKDQDVCPGDVLCTIKVVPEYQMWTGAKNGNWNNDNNWRRVTKAELLNPSSISNDFITDGGTNDNDASFVPADFTKVIIPAKPKNQLILYGLRETDNKSAVTFAGGNGTSYYIKNMVKTDDEPVVGYTTAINAPTDKINMDMSSVDLSDGNVACRAWYDHTCDQIHFNSEAQMISQQYLHYNKAWADVEVVPGRWYTFTSPITNVVAGDFYLPTDGARQNTPLFEDITYDTDLNDRFKPAVYQRTWDAKDATLWHEDATSTQVGTALNWSHVYNETNVNYDTGKGSSIKADVSAMPTANQPSKVKFRFPKADTKYTYYKPGNELGEKESEDVLSAAMVDGKRTYRIEDFTSPVEQVIGENTNGTKATYYLVGNPFMCELDLEKFFAKNDQFEKKLWTLTEGSQRVVVMTGDAVITTSENNPTLNPRYVPPFQSFFLALKDAPAAGAPIKATFDATMMRVPEESSTTGNSKIRKSAAPADGGLLRISTATADGIESAVVLADGVVRKTAGAETLFDSNLAEDVTVYSVIKGQAMTIAEVADVDTIPIGITRNDGETEINITGVASFGRPMWIADAETGEVRELDEDITLKQSGNGVRYYLLSRLASAGKPAISTPLLRTDNNTVSITAPAEAELTDLRIVTVGGMNVTNIANAGNEYTTELAEGIYIITLRCNNASYTYKVVIW